MKYIISTNCSASNREVLEYLDGNGFKPFSMEKTIKPYAYFIYLIDNNYGFIDDTDEAFELIQKGYIPVVGIKIQELFKKGE